MLRANGPTRYYVSTATCFNRYTLRPLAGPHCAASYLLNIPPVQNRAGRALRNAGKSTNGENTVDNKPTYLGDGLYCNFDGFQLEVFASDGVEDSPPVYFDPATLHALAEHARKLGFAV